MGGRSSPIPVSRVLTSGMIAAVIRQVRVDYVATGLAPSYWAINNGLCEDFAREVAIKLGGESDALYGVGNGNFTLDGDDFSSLWDWKLLQSHWGIKFTIGPSSEQISAINFGTHVWLTDGRLHYDAECPDGVNNFFELPIFKRYIVLDQRKQGIPCDDVVTDDVVPPPRCYIENPGVQVRDLVRDT